MKTLLIGCGYAGLPLARRLQAAGDEVFAWVHSPASAESLKPLGFSRVITGSVADLEPWRGIEACDRVIHCASSGGGGPDAYREVFLEGMKLIAAHQARARKLFVSSTSVYGQAAGEIVTEDSPAEPSTETGKILREAEEAARRAGAVVVRPAGIYGPGRGVLFEKLRRGEAMIEGDGSRWMNQVHRDDLVEAMLLLLARGEPGRIYNAADDTPVTQRDFYAWASECLGRPMPPEGPLNPNRKRGLTSKRVSNARLRALGWAPRYPDFRAGFGAIYSPR